MKNGMVAIPAGRFVMERRSGSDSPRGISCILMLPDADLKFSREALVDLAGRVFNSL